MPHTKPMRGQRTTKNKTSHDKPKKSAKKRQKPTKGY